MMTKWRRVNEIKGTPLKAEGKRLRRVYNFLKIIISGYFALNSLGNVARDFCAKVG